MKSFAGSHWLLRGLLVVVLTANICHVSAQQESIPPDLKKILASSDLIAVMRVSKGREGILAMKIGSILKRDTSIPHQLKKLELPVPPGYQEGDEVFVCCSESDTNEMKIFKTEDTFVRVIHWPVPSLNAPITILIDRITEWIKTGVK